MSKTSKLTITHAETIARLVAGTYGFSITEVRGKKKNCKELVELRHMMAWLFYNNTDWGLAKVGKFFRRDHTTVIHSIRKFKTINERYKREGERMAQLWLEGFEPPPKPIIVLANPETTEEKVARLMSGVDYSKYNIIERRRNPAIRRNG